MTFSSNPNSVKISTSCQIFLIRWRQTTGQISLISWCQTTGRNSGKTYGRVCVAHVCRIISPIGIETCENNSEREMLSVIQLGQGWEGSARKRRQEGKNGNAAIYMTRIHLSSSATFTKADNYRDKEYTWNPVREEDLVSPARSSGFVEAKFEFRIVLRNPTHA